MRLQQALEEDPEIIALIDKALGTDMKRVSDFAKIHLRMAAHVTEIEEVEALTVFHLFVDRSDQKGGVQQKMTISLETDFLDGLTTVETTDLIRHEVAKSMFDKAGEDATV